MPNVGSKQTSIFLGGLALAVLGQLFLSQADQPWTLFPGLLLLAGSVAVLFHFLPRGVKTVAKPNLLSPVLEMALFSLILFSAFFFRIFLVDSIPAGMHTDQGLTGLCALRILHEGWRPLGEVFDYQVPELLLFYQLAGWFGLVGSSYFTFHLFFILLSLAAFPFVYWTIRQWAGQKTALLSLFILAVMRWNWIETRNGYPSIQVPLYLFGALAAWTYWVKSRKRWALLVSAAFVGVGFYSYQAFKIVPLLFLIYAAYEFFSLKKKGRSLKPFLPFFIVALIAILPLLTVMAQRGILGHREADLFIGAKVVQEHSLKPLWDVWTGTALMFNRTGDENPRHNIPGQRMLDDVTAVLFVFGLVLAWRLRKQPEGFYPLVGFGVMALTGLLSVDPAHSNRLVSLTPFVAYFAGSAFLYLWERAKTAFGKPEIGVGVCFLLAGMAAQNFVTYFVDQANNVQCREAFGVDAAFIGRDIAASWKEAPGQNNYVVPPALFKNLTVDFLTYPAKDSLLPFNLQDWAAGRIPGDKPLFVYVEKEKSGVEDFLKSRYPGLALVTYPEMPAGLLTDVCWIPKPGPGKPWGRGLRGDYLNSSDWKARPVTVQYDPVLNFTSKFDFPFTGYPPFRIRWTGTVEFPKTGAYRFQVLTTDSAQLWLDGKTVAFEMPFRLAAGTHSLRLDFEKDSGNGLALTFIWKKPGDGKWEVVPATAFEKIGTP